MKTQRSRKGRFGAGGIGLAAVAALLALPARAQTSPGAQTMPPETRVLDGVLFAQHPGTLYVPIRDLGARLDWPVRWEADTRTLYLNHEKVPDNGRRSLPDGTQVLPVRSLEQRDVAVTWDARRRMARIAHDGDAFWVRGGGKTVSDGVTFADDPGTLYVPVRALGQSLGWRVHWEAGTETIYLDDKKVPEQQVRRLPMGRGLSPSGLWRTGAPGSPGRMSIRQRGWRREGHTFRGRDGTNASPSTATAADARLAGRTFAPGHPGEYRPIRHAHPYRFLHRRAPENAPADFERVRKNARMPRSVQVRGDYVIHGFHTVLPRAASHGRASPAGGGKPGQVVLPVGGSDTPIVVKDGWPEDAPAASLSVLRSGVQMQRIVMFRKKERQAGAGGSLLLVPAALGQETTGIVREAGRPTTSWSTLLPCRAVRCRA